MPSSVAHGLVAVATVHAFFRAAPVRLSAVAAIGAMSLDLDAVGRPFHAGDIAWLGGHRALTHALPIDLALALSLAFIVFRGVAWDGQRGRLVACLVLALGLHGVADAFATYGEGVMFFAPFSSIRLKSAWQPFDGIWPEIIGLWLPAACLIAARRGPRTTEYH